MKERIGERRDEMKWLHVDCRSVRVLCKEERGMEGGGTAEWSIAQKCSAI